MNVTDLPKSLPTINPIISSKSPYLGDGVIDTGVNVTDIEKVHDHLCYAEGVWM